MYHKKKKEREKERKTKENEKILKIQPQISRSPKTNPGDNEVEHLKATRRHSLKW